MSFGSQRIQKVAGDVEAIICSSLEWFLWLCPLRLCHGFVADALGLLLSGSLE